MQCTSLEKISCRVAYLTFSACVLAVSAHTQTVSDTTSATTPLPTRKTVSETTLISTTRAPVMTMDQMIDWQKGRAARNALPLVLDQTPPPVPQANLASLTEILPVGLNSYTYYEDVNVYYRERTKTFYYPSGDKWLAGKSPPLHTNLGVGRTVYVNGESTTAGPSDQPRIIPR